MEQTVWINLWATGDCQQFDSKEEADEDAMLHPFTKEKRIEDIRNGKQAFPITYTT